MDNTTPQSFSDQFKTFGKKFMHILKSPVYLTVIVFALISFSASAYILFFSGSQPISTSSSQSTLILPTSTPTPLPTVAPSSISPTPAATITPTPASDPTANWSTYINSSYGYSIKYPTDWVATNQGQLDPLTPSFIVFNPNVASSSAQSITLSYSTRTAAQLSAIYGAPSSGQSISIFNLTGTQYNLKNSDGVQSINVILPLTANNMIFYSMQQYQSTLQQMLGTFQLTN